MQIEIGRGKRARQAYALDDIAVVPTRRTRDPEDVSLSWQIDAFTFDAPVIGAPMDSVMSPDTAIALGRMGGMGVLNLEGLWTRYEDPSPLLEEIAHLESANYSPENTRRLQEIYSAPVQPAFWSASAAAPPPPRAEPWASASPWPRPSRTSPRPGGTTWTSPADAMCT